MMLDYFINNKNKKLALLYNEDIDNFRFIVNQKINNIKSEEEIKKRYNSINYLIENTYTFENGSISWEYVFKNGEPNIYYPVGIPAIGRIVSGTGEFVNANGFVKLVPAVDGKRYVTIKYKK